MALFQPAGKDYPDNEEPYEDNCREYCLYCHLSTSTSFLKYTFNVIGKCFCIISVMLISDYVCFMAFGELKKIVCYMSLAPLGKEEVQALAFQFIPKASNGN